MLMNKHLRTLTVKSEVEYKTSNDNNNIITCDYKPNIHLENAKQIVYMFQCF